MKLVFDIGGTNLRVAVSSDSQTILRSKTIPTPKDFEEGIQSIKEISENLLEGGNIDSSSGGIAGTLDLSKTMLVNGPHIQNWINKPLKAELERALGVTVKLENDTALGGLGEAKFGAGKESNIVAFIAIGTGLGGVRIVDGQIDKNFLGFEPGHQIIHPEGNLCDCGGKGHLESYISGPYLQKLYNQRPENITDSSVWDTVAKNLALGLTNTSVHWSPDLIILGGSVAQSISIESVQKYLKEYLTIFPEPPQIKKASLGKDAGLFGALALR